VGSSRARADHNPIKAWAKSQEDRPTMAEAIRRLVELGLKAKK
jgi:hypothetical protein